MVSRVHDGRTGSGTAPAHNTTPSRNHTGRTASVRPAAGRAGPDGAAVTADRPDDDPETARVHLHDGTLRFAAGVTGPDRAALVTDAMAAAGMPDGAYELGGQEVTVSDRVARLTRDGSIAGSTLTMDAALRRAVGAGLPIVEACRMAATTPARAIGLGETVGAIQPGWRADLTILDKDLRVVRVMRAGSWAS